MICRESKSHQPFSFSSGPRVDPAGWRDRFFLVLTHRAGTLFGRPESRPVGVSAQGRAIPLGRIPLGWRPACPIRLRPPLGRPIEGTERLIGVRPVDAQSLWLPSGQPQVECPIEVRLDGASAPQCGAHYWGERSGPHRGASPLAGHQRPLGLHSIGQNAQSQVSVMWLSGADGRAFKSDSRLTQRKGGRLWH